MATTYEAIATVTVGSGGAASIEFTSIPATFTDITTLFSIRTTEAVISSEVRLEFNGSGGTAYSSLSFRGNGSAVYNASQSSAAYLSQYFAPGASTTSSVFGNGLIYIPNYAGSNNKSVSLDAVNENNGGNAENVFLAGLWSSSSAITSIKFTPSSGSFVQYSTATLYGIKNS